MQLIEIESQLDYLEEHRLANAVLDRLDEVWERLASDERKEVAIEIYNLHSGG